MFSPKHLAKSSAFPQTFASFCKHLIVTLVVEKTPFFGQQLLKNA
jgi:hypothetical protein